MNRTPPGSRRLFEVVAQYLLRFGDGAVPERGIDTEADGDRPGGRRRRGAGRPPRLPLGGWAADRIKRHERAERS